MSRRLKATLDALKQTRAKHDSVLVSYSGGKDSRAVAALCVNTFPRCEFFYMFLVRGLECVEAELEFARKRWGANIRQYPHWVLSNCLKDEIYTGMGSQHWFTKKDSETGEWTEPKRAEWTLGDIRMLARSDANCEIIAHGAKQADSMWRRRMLKNSNRSGLLYPLERWSKVDVLAYLKVNGIPIPDSSGAAATGIDLSTPSLLWLADRHPSDFRKLCEVFPFAESVVWRRTFHGVGDVYA